MIPVLLWLLRLLGSLLIVVTVLPLIRTGKWWVRGWEMPRLQIAGLLFLPLMVAVGIVGFVGWNWEAGFWIAVCTVAMVWQASHIIPLCPAWATELPSADDDRSMFTLMTVNLKEKNTHYEQVQREVADEAADLLLLIEPNSKWVRELGELRTQFDYHHEEIRDDGLGMAVWSKLPLQDSKTRFIISQRRSSIWTTIELPGGRSANLVCIHPTPPGLDDESDDSRHDSRERDAELVLIAKEIAEHADQSWIVAGDFNDVVWSHTTRLFKRLSGMQDPRVGRTFMGTFPANYPILSCPLDHVMLSDGFRINYLGRLRITGSDHFGVVAIMALNGKQQGVQPEPVGDDPQEGQRIVREGTDDARGRNVKS